MQTHLQGSFLVFVLILQDPTSCTGNGIYSSFRNRNFWLEYSTPPTTKFPDYEDYYYDRGGGGSSTSPTTPDPGPQFLDSASNHTLVQTPVSSTTFLHCEVEDLRDFQVSWFRKEDGILKVLTIGEETFLADDRFSSAFKSPHDWRLRIRPTNSRDNGTYLCQISTHPPTLLVTNLQVIVPRVFLVDEERHEIQEKHYKPGSTIELHCIVTDYLPNFKEVFWKHGDQILSQNSERGGISVKTTLHNTTVDSHLYLAMASAADSGTYSCNVANLASSALSLHILNGKQPTNFFSFFLVLQL